MSSPSQLPDLSQWLTDAEACARLGGVSYKTLGRNKGLHPQHRKVPGRTRKQRVWDPQEIEARIPPAPARSLQVVSDNPDSHVQTDPESILPMIPAQSQAAMIMQLLQMVSDASKPAIPWITLDEAGASLGLTRQFLRRMIRRKKLDGVQDDVIKVHRADLEQLDVSDELVKPRVRRKAPGKKKGKAKRS